MENNSANVPSEEKQPVTGGEGAARPEGAEAPAAASLPDQPAKVKYTSRVKRGFGVFVMQGMAERAKELRAWNDAKPRNERVYTAKQMDDLDAAVAFMLQEAEGVEE